MNQPIKIRYFCSIKLNLLEDLFLELSFYKLFTRRIKKANSHMKAIILLTILFGLSFCLFDDNSAVVKLTQKNFKSLVLDSDELWLVEFYAPWCGHCKMSAPQLQKAAQILKGIVNIGAVDMTVEPGAGRGYEIQGYPAIKFFGANKKKPTDYNSPARTYEKFVEFLVDQLKKEVRHRQNDLKNQASSQL